jgi:hypothetical protein
MGLEGKAALNDEAAAAAAAAAAVVDYGGRGGGGGQVMARADHRWEEDWEGIN